MVNAYDTLADGQPWTHTLQNEVGAALGAIDGVAFRPVQGADYLFFKQGSTYYVRNATNGQITDSNVNAATLIQNTINSATAGETCILLGDNFDIGATQINATGVNLLGIGRNSQISYSGTSYAIKYDGTTTLQQYYKVGNFRVSLSNNDGKGLLLYERCHYFDVYWIWVEGNSHANNIGIEIDAYDNGSYWNNLWNVQPRDCGTGIKLTSSGGDSANANNLVSCIIRSPLSRGVDIDTAKDTVILGGRVEGAAAGIDGVYINDDYTFLSGMAFELTGAGANAIEITASAERTRLYPGRMNTSGAVVVDNGTNTLVPQVNVPYMRDFSDANASVSTVGDHLTISCADGNDVTVRFNFTVPPGFADLLTAELFVVSPCTGGTTMRWHLNSDFGAKDELTNVHSDSIVATDSTLAANKFESVNVAAALDGIAAGDRVGMAFTREGSHANDTLGAVLHVHSFLMRYV